MNDINEVRKTVRRININQAEETLGVWIAPDGNTNTQFQKLLDKALLWADQMRAGLIKKEESWIALTSTIWRTLCYPLNALNLTVEQCERIMSPVINQVLPALGVCQHYPRNLVFSSTQFAGVGIKHIHTLQEIARLKDMLHHTTTNSTTGQLYRTSLEYLFLEIGLSTNLTLVDYDKYKDLATNSLVKSTWAFIHKHRITLTHNIEVPRNTLNDRNLMAELCTINLPPSELESVNQCRLYLQAYYVSDIATGSSQHLALHAWDGISRTSGTTSQCRWPNQGKPCKRAWATWQNVLKRTILGRGLRLRKIWAHGFTKILPNGIGTSLPV